MLYYYQAVAHHMLGNYDESHEQFRRAITLSPELAPSAHYYQGIAHYRRGNLELAKAEFETIIETQPVSELARSAKDILAQLSVATPAGSRRWNLGVTASSEWDSNVVLLPGGTQPPGGSTGISQQHDYRTVCMAAENSG